jgi:hypothetical protein
MIRRAAASRLRELVLLGAAVVAPACADVPGRLRFDNAPPHWRVDDQGPIALPRETFAPRYDVDFWFYRPVRHVLEVPEPRTALDVNSLGEVPDSTWFTNRIGVRDLSVDEIRRGPNLDDGPVPPLQVVELRADRRGMRIEDARGAQFFVEIDPWDRPELGSAADMISQRLLWAVGYNVPENSILLFERDALSISPRGHKRVEGKKQPLVAEDLDALLARQPRTPDGRYRALASKLLPGRAVGPYRPDGVRSDDPNDRVPHEHRRDLRGQYVFFGWLAHSDLNPSNRLDMWVEEPDRPGKGHLVHYLVDFDRSLGGLSLTRHEPWDGIAHGFDYGYLLASTFTLGLWQRPWENFEPPGLRGIGRFDAAHFVPHRFRPRHYYAPFLHKDELDCFWAAKILMRLRPEHVRAAVETAQFSDPRSTEYMVETLIARQRMIGRHWFSRVNPLDQWHVEGDSLCATDLLVHYDLDAGQRMHTRYSARAYDRGGLGLRWRGSAAPDQDGDFCLDLPQGRSRDGYLIVAIRTHRGGRELAPVFVHLADDPDSGARRVIGVDRRR